jgi:hypothetical protein
MKTKTPKTPKTQQPKPQIYSFEFSELEIRALRKACAVHALTLENSIERMERRVPDNPEARKKFTAQYMIPLEQLEAVMNKIA